MKILLTVLALLFPLDIMAATPAEVMAGVDKRYGSISSISAYFSQETYSPALKRKEASEGMVYFKKPGKMRWEYTKPAKDLVISNGSVLWVFQPDLGQVVVTDMENAGPRVARDFLTGIGSLEKEFSVKIAQEKKDGYILELLPKGETPGIKKLFLDVTRDHVVQATTVEDEIGNRTTIALRDMDLESELVDTLFEFSAPKGVKVVRP